MNITDARKHASHLCDVYSTEIDHIGVISRIREHAAESMAFVTGHPEYPGQWLYLSELATSCQVDMGSFTASAFEQTEPGHTSTFLNGEFIGQEADNSMEREAAVKAELIVKYGPIRLVERVIGGHGKVFLSYQGIGTGLVRPDVPNV